MFFRLCLSTSTTTVSGAFSPSRRTGILTNNDAYDTLYYFFAYQTYLFGLSGTANENPCSNTNLQERTKLKKPALKLQNQPHEQQKKWGSLLCRGGLAQLSSTKGILRHDGRG